MKCRSCGAEVVWAVTNAGKRMPVDAKPVADGNLLLTQPAQPGVPPVAIVVGKGKGTHASHFVTCPNSRTWRKREVAA
jgi:hypothetical protein